MTDAATIFAGTANPDLARGVARELGVRLGACAVERFPDGEVSVRLEESVRGREVFVVQPTSPPVNENLFELLAFADACRRASASRVTAVVPYFGYARADKRDGRREPITASMAADLMHVVGDVRDRACLVVDDMISTGGTITGSIESLVAAGARAEFTVAATHGLLL